MTSDTIKGHIDDETRRQNAEDLAEIEEVSMVKALSQGELEVRVEVVNPDWGLPGDVHGWLQAAGFCIVDISHISEKNITVYLGPR